jgi:hypothetical protein
MPRSKPAASDADAPNPPLPPPASPAPDAPDPAYDVGPAPVVVAGDPPRRGPVLAIAVALIAVLAGGALFMAGFSLGRHDLSQPGTPASDEKAFVPFWDTYHTIINRYAGGPVDKT